MGNTPKQSFFLVVLYMENPDNTVASSHRQHLAFIAEVEGVARSTQIVDLRAWQKGVFPIEDLDLVRSTSSCNNEIT